MSQQIKKRWPRREIYLGALAIFITIGLCAAAVYYKDDLMSTAIIANYGMLGMLIVALIAGSTFSVTAIPVPYWLFTFTLPSVLAARWGTWAPIWVGLTSALGVSIGQFITFMIGYGGRNLSQRVTAKINSRLYTRAMNWVQRHGSWAVFFMSVMFNPVHLPMTIAVAALRYPPPKFLLYCFLGSLIKSLFIAFCGYFGLSSLFKFLGV